MSITLSEATLSYAQRQAAEQGFESVSEYLEHLVESTKPTEEDEADFLASLERGIASAKAGHGRPAEEVFEELAGEFGLSRISTP